MGQGGQEEMRTCRLRQGAAASNGEPKSLGPPAFLARVRLPAPTHMPVPVPPSAPLPWRCSAGRLEEAELVAQEVALVFMGAGFDEAGRQPLPKQMREERYAVRRQGGMAGAASGLRGDKEGRCLTMCRPPAVELRHPWCLCMPASQLLTAHRTSLALDLALPPAPPRLSLAFSPQPDVQESMHLVTLAADFQTNDFRRFSAVYNPDDLRACFFELFEQICAT